ncbi:MAG: tetratricopeptide repeat protein [Nitrospirae bacterium]|nr:tetratricopeptide repeat protein [Nitrospirota bacterium]
MSLEDIEKLKARLEKDPNSKLFLPLAEEYRKEGMFEEAIEVLKTGLERHPTYTSARVLLAKVYIDKGQLVEARAELEQVIDSVPDNLFAQRKLADIYRDMGLREKAIEHYERVIELNPLDDEAMDILKSLRGSEEPVGQEDAEQITEDAQEVVEEAKEIVEDDIQLPEEGVTIGEEAVEGVEEVVEESEDIKLSEDVAVEEETDSPEVPPVDIEEEHYTEKTQDDLSSFSQPDEEEPFMTDESPLDLDSLSLEEDRKEKEEDLNLGIDFGDYEEFAQFINEEIHEMEGIAEATSVEESEEGVMFAEEGPGTAEVSEQDVAEVETGERDFFRLDRETVRDTGKLLAEADECIRREEYGRALDIYMEIIKMDPDNAKAKQRTEELKQFLKLLGKDAEIIINRLENFLNGLRRRKDEFFRSS